MPERKVAIGEGRSSSRCGLPAEADRTTENLSLILALGYGHWGPFRQSAHSHLGSGPQGYQAHFREKHRQVAESDFTQLLLANLAGAGEAWYS